MNHNAPAAVIGKNEPGITGLHVSGSGAAKRIAHKPTGVLSPDFVKALQAYGVGLSRLDMQKAPNTSGGHPNLRFAVDLLQSECLEMVCQRAMQYNGTDIVVIDVGAKFRKIGKLLKKRFTPEFEDLWSKKRVP